MDGLSALSVAAAVTQFIEFGCYLVSKSKEIYKSADGTSIQHVEAEAAINRLLELNERIKTSLQLEHRDIGVVSRGDQAAIQTICDGCATISTELLQKLEKLKIQKGQKITGYKSFRQALKSVWSKAALENAAARLDSFRKEMDAHILVSLSERFNNLSILQDERFTSLDSGLRGTIEALLRDLVKMHKKVDEVLYLQRVVSTRGLGICNCSVETLAAHSAMFAKRVNTSILQALRFSTMTHRYLEIPEPHKKTFSWIFHQCEGGDQTTCICKDAAIPSSTFCRWFQGGGGIYWMNGKAGSGKSTLMKYIAENWSSQQQLLLWSRRYGVHISHFYFWNAGTELQRSHDGLLRSLLYDVLYKRPDLIQDAFSEAWAEAQPDGCVKCANEKVRIPEWAFSMKTLEMALVRLAQKTSPDFGLLFLVDGLDEFEGDADFLVRLLKDISAFPYVKICVSSRPWLVFEEAFAGYPGLRLQDLTSEDIKLSTRETLRTHQMMQLLELSNPSGAASLVQRIVERASGVFLWVCLAVKSLLSGLRNRDDIPDLLRRVDSFPTSLDAFYGRIVDHIDPIYLDQACKIFQIFDSMLSLDFHPSILELDLAINTELNETALIVKSRAQVIESRCERMTSHLSSRCAGLLEVHDVRRLLSGSKANATNLDRDTIAMLRELKGYHKVSYFHRTARDFLRSDQGRSKFPYGSVRASGFDPHLQLLVSYAANLERGFRTFYLHLGSSKKSRYYTTVHLAFRCAQRIRIDAENFTKSFHQLYLLLLEWWEECFQSKSSNARLEAEKWRENFLLHSSFYGLWSFVDFMLSSNKTPNLLHPEKGKPSLLKYALGIYDDDEEELAGKPNLICPPMVKILLEHGADPNEPSIEPTQSLFMLLIHRVDRLGSKRWSTDRIEPGPISFVSSPLTEDRGKLTGTEKGDCLAKYGEILRLFLRYGTDRAPCSPYHRCAICFHRFPLSIKDIIEDVYQPILPAEAALLRTEARLQKKKKAIKSLKRRGYSADYSDEAPQKRQREPDGYGP